MKIVLASRNQKKINELSVLVSGLGIEVVAVSEFSEVPEVEETGSTFSENAALKAEAVCAATGLASIADDSGLVIEALGGKPGIHSARFAGEKATDADNNNMLIKKLSGKQNRAAKFVCVIAFAKPGKKTIFFSGETTGIILDSPRGDNGFGYDPLFLSDDLGKTFAQAAAEEKNYVSHRGRALAEFVKHCKTCKVI